MDKNKLKNLLEDEEAQDTKKPENAVNLGALSKRDIFSNIQANPRLKASTFENLNK